VIVNDGSTDHTADVLRGLGLPADRFTYVEQANAGQSRLARQRFVYGLLADELAGGVHALQLTTLTPEEERHPKAPGRGGLHP